MNVMVKGYRVFAFGEERESEINTTQNEEQDVAKPDNYIYN